MRAARGGGRASVPLSNARGLGGPVARDRVLGGSRRASLSDRIMRLGDSDSDLSDDPVSPRAERAGGGALSPRGGGRLGLGAASGKAGGSAAAAPVVVAPAGDDMMALEDLDSDGFSD